MKVGDVVKGRSRPPRDMILRPRAPEGVGLVIKRAGREIVYVLWGSGKYNPINMRLLEKVK